MKVLNRKKEEKGAEVSKGEIDPKKGGEVEGLIRKGYLT